jgi:hypothetical protein
VIGRVLLLSGDLFSGAAIADPGTDLITTGLPHGFVTGSRINLSGTLPSGLSSPDLWVIGDTATTFKVAGSLANAQSGASLPLGSAGASIIITEKELSIADSIQVLVNKEISAFPRQPLDAVGAANSSGLKPVAIYYTNTGSSFAYKHILITRGGTVTAGDSAGIDFSMLETLPLDQVIGSGDSKLLQLSLGAV